MVKTTQYKNLVGFRYRFNFVIHNPTETRVIGGGRREADPAPGRERPVLVERGARPVKGRCLNRKRGVCPSCRAFSASLVVAVKGVQHVNTLWRPGIIADLSRRAGGGR